MSTLNSAVDSKSKSTAICYVGDRVEAQEGASSRHLAPCLPGHRATACFSHLWLDAMLHLGCGKKSACVRAQTCDAW
ncbi:hypothetical protein WJX79_007085 [Trebouxia sp. C0005]